MTTPKPRQLEPEEEEELDLRDEVDAAFYGCSREEKEERDRQLIEDLRAMEEEEERELNRQAYERKMLEDLGLDDMPDPDREDDWDWGDW